LVAALQSLVRGVQEGHDIRVSLDAEAVDEGVEPDRRLVVYRIVQEALANAARHAAAPTASVRVHREAGQILVEVSDTGTGFDPSAIESGYAGRSGLGLMGMRERAAAAGGTLHIRSSPGQGTTVSASIPAAIRGGESENA
jgi:signal transduction histidine kinase